MKDRAPPVELTPPPAPPAAPPQVAAAPDQPAPAAKAEPKAEPREARPRAEPAGKAAFSVQVVATPSRAEADKLVVKLKEFTPRVEETEVSGRGRMYRVRVGAFATKPEAEKFLKAFNGKTGSKGLVVASVKP